MSNRAWGAIDVHPDDADRARVLLDSVSHIDDEDTTDDGLHRFNFYDSSGGAYHEAEEMKAAGIPFRHYWDGYPGEWQAGQSIEIPGSERVEAGEDGPVAAVYPDGSVSEQGVKDGVEFHRLHSLLVKREGVPA